MLDFFKQPNEQIAIAVDFSRALGSENPEPIKSVTFTAERNGEDVTDDVIVPGTTRIDRFTNRAVVQLYHGIRGEYKITCTVRAGNMKLEKDLRMGVREN
jgi:hypothetical protein